MSGAVVTTLLAVVALAGLGPVFRQGARPRADPARRPGSAESGHSERLGQKGAGGCERPPVGGLLVLDAGDGIRHCVRVGEPVHGAGAVRSTKWATRYLGGDDPVPAAALRELSDAACLSRLDEAQEEREALIAIFTTAVPAALPVSHLDANRRFRGTR